MELPVIDQERRWEGLTPVALRPYLMEVEDLLQGLRSIQILIVRITYVLN
jgi:hypothetical protein